MPKPKYRVGDIVVISLQGKVSEVGLSPIGDPEYGIVYGGRRTVCDIPERFVTDPKISKRK